jgi:hypothetical protein
VNATLDAPGTRCAFEWHDCSHLVAGCGGFDEHHPVPVELAGDPDQPLLALCPIHHRRQHALIRYLVECLVDQTPVQAAVTVHFTRAERETAEAALAHWDAAGRPAVRGWPCPAARRSQ